MNWKHALGIASLVLLAIPLVVATIALLQSAGNQPRALCGNQLLEEGESPQNCCEDTGCLSSQICTNHSCIAISCGYCEYAANETCHKYECCSDSECGKNETCSSNTNKCAEIECECGYIKNRTCVEYECCKGWECPSGLCSNNKCVVEEQKKTAAAEEKSSRVRRSSGSESSSQEQQAQQQTPQPPQTCTPNPEVCDGIDKDCNGKTDDGELCPGGQLCIYGSCKTANTDYKVQPVIFYPTDYANDQEMTNYLKEKFEEIRQFYLTKAGTTFTMLQPQVVSGDHSHEWYWCVDNQQGCVPNNFEANLVAELQNKELTKGNRWDDYTTYNVVWVVAFGGGGYAGGRSYSSGGGLAINGDAGVYAAKDHACGRILDYYYSPTEPNNIKDICKNSWVPSGNYGFSTGALGHELGHAFNLPHPDGYPGTTAADWEKTLIGYHWNYPNTGLLEQDKARLAQSPFINTKS